MAAGAIGDAGSADAANGGNVVLGKTNRATATTSVDTTSGVALSGTSSAKNQAGLKGTNTSAGGGNGVHGVSSHGIGVQGSSSANGQSGVQGVDSSTSGGVGVSGTSAHGVGVSGTTASTEGDAAAAEGSVTSKAPGSYSAGVRGVNNGTGGQGIGVYGSQAGEGWGVYGTAVNGIGVYGLATTGSGVVGSTGNSSSDWALYGYGNIGATGTKSAVVPGIDGDHVTLYCVESPECWFEDFGSARLSAGSVTVRIDPAFAHTIETHDYFVFLQAEGECQGLSVVDKTATGFTVRELGGGRSAVPFSYRITARRARVSAPRLKPATLPNRLSQGAAD